MTIALRARIDRLERGPLGPPTVRHNDCPGGPTCLMVEGEPAPDLADAARCRLCGEVHLLVITEVIVP